MPRVAYIVIAHKSPGQVARLLRRLSTDEATSLVHVDLRAGPAVEEELRHAVRDLPRVRFLERHRCFWGGFGMVRAAVKGLDELVRRDVPFEYAVLLSGQDYPLKHAAEIEWALDEAKGRSYIANTPLPTAFWPDGGLSRIERFHVISYRALHLPVPWHRRIPGGLQPFGGGAWWSLARPVVEHVVDFVRRNPAFVRFFEHVLHPSELFFQTVVMNSPLAETVVDHHLHYIDWPAGAANPAVLRATDFEKLVATDRLFARKFDADLDASILDLLDSQIERRAAVAAR